VCSCSHPAVAPPLILDTSITTFRTRIWQIKIPDWTRICCSSGYRYFARGATVETLIHRSRCRTCCGVSPLRAGLRAERCRTGGGKGKNRQLAFVLRRNDTMVVISLTQGPRKWQSGSSARLAPAPARELRIQNNNDPRSCHDGPTKQENARTFHAATMLSTAKSTAAKRAVRRGVKM
jgi:hypothetical protein